MTDKQKAKRFDEVLEQLKGLIEIAREDRCAIVEKDIIDIFPELKESADEMLRKELIEHIKANRDTGFVIFQKFSPDDVIDWLEKQRDTKWSEEDESKVEDIVYFLNTAKTHYASTEVIDDCIEWLKSLKQRMEEQL